MKLKGKTMIITGATSGIGEQIAYSLAKEKCSLILTYCHKQNESVAKKCLELGAPLVKFFHLDLTDDKSILSFSKKSLKESKKISVLINNAGVIQWKPLQEQTFKEIESQLRTNLEGPVKLTRVLIPHIKDGIINIASKAGINPSPNLSYTPYSASKFGMRGFTKALTNENPRLKLIAINPGAVATPMTRFQGISPKKISSAIVDALKNLENTSSGSDINLF